MVVPCRPICNMLCFRISDGCFSASLVYYRKCQICSCKCGTTWPCRSSCRGSSSSSSSSSIVLECCSVCCRSQCKTRAASFLSISHTSTKMLVSFGIFLSSNSLWSISLLLCRECFGLALTMLYKWSSSVLCSLNSLCLHSLTHVNVDSGRSWVFCCRRDWRHRLMTSSTDDVINWWRQCLLCCQRAHSSLVKAQQLNPMVDVRVDTESASDKSAEFFEAFDVVCATCCTLSELLRLDDICRRHNIAFFAGDVFGYFGYMFADLHEHEYAE